jgi:8-oxo-dGTP diphosphatase
MRAGAIILDDHLIALIERFREGNHYFVFPGGGIEENESQEDAVVREVLEETGLDVVVDRLIAEVHYQDEKQFYYLVQIVGGDFGSGKGKEMLGLAPPDWGTYRSVWKNISELSVLDGWPRPLFELVSRFPDEGIPKDAIIIQDPGGITATPLKEG